jgi:hypothetical protein
MENKVELQRSGNGGQNLSMDIKKVKHFNYMSCNFQMVQSSSFEA